MLNKLKNLQDKPEKTKIKIVWILTIFCMIVIAGGWYVSLSFNKNERYNYDKSILSSFPDFQKELGDINKISEDYKTLANGVVVESKQKEIEEIVKNYIEENNYLKDGNVSDLELKNIEKLKNNWFVEYEQSYKDILVNKSSVSFIIDSGEKKVTSSDSNFDPNIKLDTIKPEITEDDAYDLIVKNLGNKDFNLKNSELVIHKDDDNSLIKYYLAWKINVFSLEPPQDYVYVVNAENGEIILMVIDGN